LQIKLSVAAYIFWAMSQTLCPGCGSAMIKEIIYGLPDIENFDFEHHEVGGCCVSDDDPSYLCKNCNLEF